MKTGFYPILIISFLLQGCNHNDTKLNAQMNMEIKYNITPKTVAEMHWMNQPQSFVVEDNSLKISVNKGTDFFNNPEDGTIVGSAPFLNKAVEGDFIVKSLVEPDFSSQWNAVAIMMHIDSLNWIKFAFENSDATGRGIVSVVTKSSSDDANGVTLNGEKRLWLAMVRKGNIYSMHWSIDGENFHMARLTAMTNQNVVKIGIEAQSPVGDDATHQIHFFDIQEKSIKDLRNLNQP